MKKSSIEANNRILPLRWEIIEHHLEKIEVETAQLQEELIATDYQIIKSYEYALV